MLSDILWYKKIVHAYEVYEKKEDTKNKRKRLERHMEKTVEENNISSKRLTYCLGMGLLFFWRGQVLLCLGQEILLDQLLCLVTLDISFFLIFCACPDEAPLIRRTSPEAVRLSKGIFIGLAGVGSPACRILCPHFFTPVLLIGILLFPAMDDVLALGTWTLYGLTLRYHTKSQPV